MTKIEEDRFIYFHFAELIAQRRDAWLNRVSSSQQQKEAATSKQGAQAEEQPTPCSPKPVDDQDDRTPAVSPVYKSFTENLRIASKPDPSDDVTDQTRDDVTDQTRDDVTDQTPPSGREPSDLSNLKIEDDGRGDGPLPKSTQRTVQPSVKMEAEVHRVDETGDCKMNGPGSHRQTASAQTAPPKPQPMPEKTTDQQKLKAFLEKAFNCTLTVMDEVSRMRFSGGKMRVPPGQFPTSLEDLGGRMEVLVHQAFDKQINKVRCSIFKETFDLEFASFRGWELSVYFADSTGCEVGVLQ